MLCVGTRLCYAERYLGGRLDILNAFSDKHTFLLMRLTCCCPQSCSRKTGIYSSWWGGLCLAGKCGCLIVSISYNTLWFIGVEGFHLPLSWYHSALCRYNRSEQRLLIKLVPKHGFFFFSALGWQDRITRIKSD